MMSGLLALCVSVAATGCLNPKRQQPTAEKPSVAPATQPQGVEPLALDASVIKPMYTELMAIDLPTVVNVATARNFDIQRARQAVEASRGRYESQVGAVFPALVPTALFEHVEGTVRATEGNLVRVGFNTFQPSLAVQWVVNPGRVIHDLVAAKKRLFASEYDEEAVMLATLRRSAIQFYDLVLAQTRVSAAELGVKEAQELARISDIRLRTGMGVPADNLRAEARLAGRRQDLISALNEFYQASVNLAVTLHLDSAVTLVPSIETLPPVRLVSDDLPIGGLLDIAVTFRPDLQSVRTLAEAVAADRGSTWWGGFGPQFELQYQYGGITGHANNVKDPDGIPSNLIVNPGSTSGSFSSNPTTNGLVKEGIFRGSRWLDGRDDQTYGFSDQQRVSAGARWRLSLAAFGDMKTAKAIEKQAALEAERRLDKVKAQVVSASQASRTNGALMSLAQQQVASAQEALRLTEANLQAGTMTLLDVLQGQDAATQARLRHAEAVVRFNQSQIDLLAALGLLDAAALGVPADDDTNAG